MNLTPFRLLIAGLALAALGAASPGAAPGPPAVDFVRVWPMWQEADAFKRIAEYFTGREVPGDSVVMRTHPTVRDGYYFVARIKNTGVDLTGAKFVLQVITPTQPEPEVFIFPANAAPGVKVFEIGLTGADWPEKKTKPVAWSLELQDAAGHPLAEKQSFLWSKPPGRP